MKRLKIIILALILTIVPSVLYAGISVFQYSLGSIAAVGEFTPPVVPTPSPVPTYSYVLPTSDIIPEYFQASVLSKNVGVTFLDSDTIVAIGDYNKEYLRQFYIDNSVTLASLDNGISDDNDLRLRSGNMFKWYYAGFVWQDKLKFASVNYWTIYDTTSSNEVTIAALNDHHQPNGVIRMHGASTNVLIDAYSIPDIYHYSFINLSSVLLNGHTYELRNSDNITVTINYSDKSCISRALKPNQEGYKTNSIAKYVYAGAWMSGLGQYPMTLFDGQSGYVVNQETGQAKDFPWTLIANDSRIAASIQSTQGWIHGENTYEMNFSAVTTPGIYYIYMPGVGRSFAFEITTNVYSYPYYACMRSLWYKSAVNHRQPYTPVAWERDTKFTQIFKGYHVSEDEASWGYTDDYGIVLVTANRNIMYKEDVVVGDNGTRWRCKLDHIANGENVPSSGVYYATYWEAAGTSATNNIWVSGNVYLYTSTSAEGTMMEWCQYYVDNGPATESMSCWGGWHDGNDWDRERGTRHFRIIDNICAVRDFNPHICEDGDLNIPSSNNGLPDDLDLSIQGANPLLQMQTAYVTGGIGLWTNTYESGGMYTEDKPYFTAHPTRKSSKQSARYLAKLAYSVWRVSPSAEIVDTLAQAAVLANDYSNRQDVTYNSASFFLGNLECMYKEPPLGHEKSWKNGDEFFTCAYLELLAIEGIIPSYSYYHQRVLDTQDALDMSISDNNEYLYPRYFQEISVLDLYATDRFPTFNAKFKYRIDVLVSGLQSASDIEPYHRPQFPTTDSKYVSLGYGNYHRFSQWILAKYFIDLHDTGVASTYNMKILEHCGNTLLGCNEIGESEVIGLGKCSADEMQLSIWTNSETVEGIPGFVPYRFSGSLDVDCTYMGSGIFNVENDYWGMPGSIQASFLPYALDTPSINAIPNQIYGATNNILYTAKYNAIRTIQYPYVPLYHRYYLIGGYYPGNNEFTTWETIAPILLLFGALNDGRIQVNPSRQIVEPIHNRTDAPYSGYRMH